MMLNSCNAGWLRWSYPWCEYRETSQSCFLGLGMRWSCVSWWYVSYQTLLPTIPVYLIRSVSPLFLIVYSHISAAYNNFIGPFIANWSNQTTSPTNSYARPISSMTTKHILGCTNRGGSYNIIGVYFNCIWYAGNENGVIRCSLFGSTYAHAGLMANMACCIRGGGKKSPMTSAPTTQKPTSKPSTGKPTTMALFKPATHKPTTRTSSKPTTCTTTYKPTQVPNSEPTTDSPTTDSPTTNSPTMDSPMTYSPYVDSPTTDSPRTAKSTTHKPIFFASSPHTNPQHASPLHPSLFYNYGAQRWGVSRTGMMICEDQDGVIIFWRVMIL